MMQATQERPAEYIHSQLVKIPTPRRPELLERHELSESFGDFSEQLWEEFARNLPRNPMPEFLIIIIYEGKILDGYNRVHAAVPEGLVHLLDFREYVGDSPGLLANMLNGYRRNIHDPDYDPDDPHKPNEYLANILTRNLLYDKKLKIQQGGNPGALRVQEIADQTGSSTRQVRRVITTEEAGLGEYVTSGKITNEDGEQIVRAGLAPAVLSGELPIDEAQDQVKEKRRQRSLNRALRVAGADKPAAAVQGEAPEPTQAAALPVPDVETVSETPSDPVVEPRGEAAPASASDENDKAALDQAQEKYRNLRQEYETLRASHAALEQTLERVQQELTTMTQRFHEADESRTQLAQEIAELRALAVDAEVVPVPLPASA